MLGPELDKLAIRIFRSYWRLLLEQPNTYIVPAVWGIKKDGELDSTQREIYSIIRPVIDRTLNAPEFQGLNRNQTFAFRYLIHAYLIAKIGYMIEYFKNRCVKVPIESNPLDTIMQSLEPVGHA